MHTTHDPTLVQLYTMAPSPVLSTEDTARLRPSRYKTPTKGDKVLTALIDNLLTTFIGTLPHSHTPSWQTKN